jgi:hypothetical protein
MKYFIILTSVLFFVIVGSLSAQMKGGVGLKGGLNYNSNGNYFKNAQLIMEDPFSNLGFHVGGFAKANFGILFLRPELIYSQLKTVVQNETYLIKRADAPVLVGTSFFGLFSIFAGPSFHYRLKDDLQDFSFQDVENNFSTGYQFGVEVNLGPLGLDLRYERELEGRSLSIDNAISTLDNFKFKQMILGLSFKF